MRMLWLTWTGVPVYDLWTFQKGMPFLVKPKLAAEQATKHKDFLKYLLSNRRKKRGETVKSKAKKPSYETDDNKHLVAQTGDMCMNHCKDKMLHDRDTLKMTSIRKRKCCSSHSSEASKKSRKNAVNVLDTIKNLENMRRPHDTKGENIIVAEQRTICRDPAKTCKSLSVDDKNAQSNKKHGKRRVDEIGRQLTESMCKKRKITKQTEVRVINTFDTIFLALLCPNGVGTFYDLWKKNEIQKWKLSHTFLMSKGCEWHYLLLCACWLILPNRPNVAYTGRQWSALSSSLSSYV